MKICEENLKKLIETLSSQLPPLDSTADTPINEKIVPVRIYTPWSQSIWLPVEFDGKDKLWGFVNQGDRRSAEWGYFTLSEFVKMGDLKETRTSLHVVADTAFTPTPFDKTYGDFLTLHQGVSVEVQLLGTEFEGVVKPTIEERWTKYGVDRLVGKRVVAVRYMDKEECEHMGWESRPIAIFFNDGSFIFPSRDDEGNDAGALFGQGSDGDWTFPVIGLNMK